MERSRVEHRQAWAAPVHVDLWKMESVEFWNPTPETVEAEVVDQDKEAFQA
jgi:hypothetical protein